MTAKRRTFTFLGWITWKVVRVFWKVLAMFGSEFAARRLDDARHREHRNPVARRVGRTITGRRT